ncbi:hypothetical protein Pmani_016486 [Petrolisthes manimaculis]|uniref:Isopenicillin N synthase-like Fe(2+) 2OG dioxygenase domain-containing protein n=1 Tax=Petrolisthes manimaculis TaxID=1843537 RepID=A0AAE1PRL8_9EUCA|nr:hypothetical protein Pmani_016486 [Petrolisthes manimaculis]
MASLLNRYGEKQDLHEAYLIRTAEDLPSKDLTAEDLPNKDLTAEDLPGKNLADKDLVPGWRIATESLHSSMKILSSVILDALSLAIGKERDYLASLHRSEGGKKSFKVLRMGHYPPTNPDAAQTSIRFDEHCDVCTFTLLLQDNMGGLQGRDKDGNWFDLTPEPDTIILLAAQFIQFYSNEKYKALMVKFQPGPPLPHTSPNHHPMCTTI